MLEKQRKGAYLSKDHQEGGSRDKWEIHQRAFLAKKVVVSQISASLNNKM